MSILTTRWADASVVVCISGKTPQNAKHAIDEIVNRRDRDVCQKITDVNLIDSRGRRHQAKSPVADIQTVLRVRKVDGSQVFARGRRGVHNGPNDKPRKQSN